MAVEQLHGGLDVIQQSEVPEIPPTYKGSPIIPNGHTNGKSATQQTTPVVTNGVRKDHITRDYAIPLNTEYAYTPRKLRVFTIGAGFSGLLMCHKIQHKFSELGEYIEHTLFEAHDDIGGTWLMNNYPGVQCDVPAHIYVSV